VGGNATIVHSQFLHNTAFNLGGGLFTLGNAHVTDSTFEDNTAANNWGGGIFANLTTALTNTTFLNNKSKYAAEAWPNTARVR